MSGFAMIEGRLARSDDSQAVERAMLTIKARLDECASFLSLDRSTAELEGIFNEINGLIDIWNKNVNFLHRNERQRAIDEVKSVIAELKWPPREVPPAGSSS